MYSATGIYPMENDGNAGLKLDNKVHGATMGPTWGREDPGGPHVGPMNLAIWEALASCSSNFNSWGRNKPGFNISTFSVHMNLHCNDKTVMVPSYLFKGDLYIYTFEKWHLYSEATPWFKLYLLKNNTYPSWHISCTWPLAPIGQYVSLF